MKLAYPHLLFGDRFIEGFLRLLIERIAFGEKPCLSHISTDQLYIDGDSLDLSGATSPALEEFLRRHLGIPAPCTSWKDIRKHSVRNILLYRHVHRTRSPFKILNLHLNLANKSINNDDIVLDNTFNIQSIKGFNILN